MEEQQQQQLYNYKSQENFPNWGNCWKFSQEKNYKKVYFWTVFACQSIISKSPTIQDPLLMPLIGYVFVCVSNSCKSMHEKKH